MITLDPVRVQFYEQSALAFQVVESMGGDSARGDWAGPMGGVVRPMLKWTTEFEPAEVASL